jgi:hypothetical protein
MNLRRMEAESRGYVEGTGGIEQLISRQASGLLCVPLVVMECGDTTGKPDTCKVAHLKRLESR